MTPLDELFMAQTMTTRVVEHADQSEENSFIGVYEDGEPINPISDEFVYKETTFSRGIVGPTGTQSPSKARKPLAVKKRAGQVYAIKTHRDLPAPLLMMAQGQNSAMPDPEGWLEDNLRDMTNEVNRGRNYWAAQSLLVGTVDLSTIPNADLPGATVLTYPVATLNAANGAWSNPGSKIRKDMALIKKTYRRNTGFSPGEALGSDAHEIYITENTQFANTVDGGGVPTLAQRKIENSYLEGGSIIRIGGMDWRFVDDYYVTDANAATAEAGDTEPTKSEVASDEDLVAILPPRSRRRECFAMAQGRAWIPNGLITSMATGKPSSLLTEVRGWYAYLELITNPIGLRLHVGWHGTLIQKRRRSVLVFNATP